METFLSLPVMILPSWQLLQESPALETCASWLKATSVAPFTLKVTVLGFPLWHLVQNFSSLMLKAFTPVWQAPQDLVASISAMVYFFFCFMLKMALWQILQLFLYFSRCKSWLKITGSAFLNVNGISLVSFAAESTGSMVKMASIIRKRLDFIYQLLKCWNRLRGEVVIIYTSTHGASILIPISSATFV